MEKKINIAELLKDCPHGMELDCTLFDDVHFDSVDEVCDIIKCYIKDSHHKIGISFNKYGHYSNIRKAKCVIFPKGKTTWEGFHRPFDDGDIVFTTLGNIAIIRKPIEVELFYVYGIMVGNGFYKDETAQVVVERHATEEEKQKLFKAIKEHGYKWNAETKTLEKLIEPKFKVGDRVRLKSNPDYIYTIYCLTWDDNKKLAYKLLPKNDKHLILVSLNKQDNYELVPNKFDITTLKPFDKVLVRQNNSGIWGIDLFGFYNEGYYHTTGNCIYVQCIPYEGNEYLRGTTNDCDDYYKIWK